MKKVVKDIMSYNVWAAVDERPLMDYSNFSKEEATKIF